MEEKKSLSQRIAGKIPIFSKEMPEHKPVLSWEAPEFYFVDKSIVWGVIFIIIMVALAGVFVFFGQIMVAVLALVFLIVTLKLAYAKPEKLEYRIDHDGLRVSGWLHPFGKEIVGFWTGRQGSLNVVYFKTSSLWSEHFAVPIGNIKPKKMARALEKYVPELITSPTSTPKAVRS